MSENKPADWTCPRMTAEESAEIVPSNSTPITFEIDGRRIEIRKGDHIGKKFNIRLSWAGRKMEE